MSLRLIMTSLVLLVGLCAYAAWGHPYPSIAELRKEPARWDGRTVSGFYGAEVRERTAAGFVLTHEGASVRVIAPERAGEIPTENPWATTVALTGRFEAPETIHAERLYISRRRWAKIAVSVAALPAVPFILYFAVGWDRRARALRLR